MTMDLSPERWRRIDAVFEQVLDAPPEQRAELLNRLAAGDAELRQEVTALLDAAARANGFLDTAAASVAAASFVDASEPPPSEQPGTLIDRYRLIEEIGRGGMGTVWLAERSDGQFEHRVALKLIKRGMDSDEILARFRRERQILARLEHSNIARLLDGGMQDDGRPYFVMEYVAGRAITVVCDEQRLPIEARLRLFVIACRAIGYAHRNLVVHRDIKPSNVLVDRQGAIKLLDFGIARLLSEEAGLDSPATTPTARLMTPEYASPEQLAGARVTTASDVYQLGVLLYELLTGQRPRLEGETSGETTRRPSAAVRRSTTRTHPNGSREIIAPEVVSAQRGTTAERLQRRLRGDLDTITLRALREEPERRYPSAEDLAEDVERHLGNRPIRFGGDRAAYRAAKFVRRHRLGVATGAGVLGLTVALLGFDSLRVRRERDRARHEAEKAIEVGQLMARFLQGWSPDASDRGEVSAKKLLGEAGVRAERELGDRPEMLAATLSILGDFHTTLGEWRMADSLLGRAAAIQGRPGTPPSADLAATLVRQGRLYRMTGRHAGAIRAVEQALDLHRDLLGRRHAETLRVQRELSLTLRGGKRYREAEAHLRDILAALEPSARTSSPFALEVASDLGYALFQQARYDEAIEILRPTLTRQRALFGDVHLATLTTIRSLGSALRDRGDLDEAEVLYRDALRIARALYGYDHPESEGAVLVLALVLERKNRLEEAEALAQQALEINRRIHGPDHPGAWGHLGHLGALRLDRGDPRAAERLLRLALERSRIASPQGDPDQADILNRLAYLLVQRDAADADPIYREAVAFDAARPADAPDFVSDGIHFLAWAEHEKGDSSDAAKDYRRALLIYQRQLPENHPYLIAVRQSLQALPP